VVRSDLPGQGSRLGEELANWPSPLPDLPPPWEAPTLDLSQASSPPTVQELLDALSVAQNELECWQAMHTEYGSSYAEPTSESDEPMESFADPSPILVERKSHSPADAFDKWIKEVEEGKTPSADPWESLFPQRPTMGMTIVPSSEESTEAYSSDEEILETPASPEHLPAATEPGAAERPENDRIPRDPSDHRSMAPFADPQGSGALAAWFPSETEEFARLFDVLDIVNNELRCRDELARSRAASEPPTSVGADFP
jgi:hypothetical protein